MYAISDPFPVCLSGKVNAKISKPEHFTSSYRCFKKFDETLFLNDLSSCHEYFKYDRESVDEDFAAWHSVLIQYLDRHAPIKNKRVKSSRLPVWPQGYKTVFMLNSTEHEISTAHKN